MLFIMLFYNAYLQSAIIFSLPHMLTQDPIEYALVETTSVLAK